MNTFKKQLDELSDFALEISGIKNDYNADDMANATLVFFEVFCSLMHDKHNDKLTQKQMEALALEAGKSIHQTILLFTGLDMKDVF